MECKVLEVRDRATFIPVLAADMNPTEFIHTHWGLPGSDNDPDMLAERELYLLRRVGYPCDGQPNIMITRLSGEGHASADPYYWGDRTMAVAHLFIIEHWSALKQGDVVDVEFILGETSAPKLSERITERA